jgi:hypothetical protein
MELLNVYEAELMLRVISVKDVRMTIVRRNIECV